MSDNSKFKAVSKCRVETRQNVQQYRDNATLRKYIRRLCNELLDKDDYVGALDDILSEIVRLKNIERDFKRQQNVSDLFQEIYNLYHIVQDLEKT